MKHLELQDAIARNPDAIIKEVMRVLTGKEIEVSPKIRMKFRKAAYSCIGKMGSGGMSSKKGLESCLADRWGRLAVREKMISKNELKRRIESIGVDNLLDEIGEALEKGKEKALLGYLNKL